MNLINEEKDMNTIEELVATNRLLTDLTEAGSWVIDYAPDGSVASVQWGDGFRCQRRNTVPVRCRWHME